MERSTLMYIVLKIHSGCFVEKTVGGETRAGKPVRSYHLRVESIGLADRLTWFERKRVM